MLSRPPAIRVALVGTQRVLLDPLGTLIEQEPDLRVLRDLPRPGRLTAPEVAEEPDVTLFDLDETGSSDAIYAHLSATAAVCRTVAMTVAPTPLVEYRAFEAGAVGVLSKRESTELLLRAIRKVHAGEAWFGRTAVARLLESARAHGAGARNPRRKPALSRRETELIALVGEGRRNADIARQLLTSEATVRAGLTTLFRKLGLAGRFDLMVYASRHGFLARRTATALAPALPERSES